jgi:steroid delta-isomerase-like uncharacterized protein
LVNDFITGWSSNDPAKAVAVYADEAAFEDVAQGVTHSGKAALKEFAAELFKASSDTIFTLTTANTDGDHFTIEWEVAGTNDGEGAGFPATNKRFSVRGVSIGRLNADGKIVEQRDYYDMATLLSQLGLLPASNA